MFPRRAGVLGVVITAAVLAGVDVSGARGPAAAPAEYMSPIAAAHDRRAPVAASAGPGLFGSGGGLTPKERKALDIVSISAAGAADIGLTVTVTFAGNVEHALGRGNLKSAVVGLIVSPEDDTFENAHLATRGAGALGRTLRDTSSPDAGVLRDGRRLTFFISGPGAENVGSVRVKAFATFPAPGREAVAAAVDDTWWEELEKAIAADEAFVDDPLHAPERETTCEGAKEVQRLVDEMLLRAREREKSIKELKRHFEQKIPELEADLSSQNWRHAAATLTAIGTSFATPLAIFAGGSGSAGLLAHAGALKTIQSARELKEELRAAIRSLKLDVRLADAFLDANRRLIEKLLHFKGRADAVVAQLCAKVSVAPTWKHNPDLRKTNVCVDISAEQAFGAREPLKGTYTVFLRGPSINAGTNGRQPLEDGKGRFVGTIKKEGAHEADIEVFDEAGRRVARFTHAFVVAGSPQDGPEATPPCPKPTQ
jgi:hypothetical protein